MGGRPLGLIEALQHEWAPRPPGMASRTEADCEGCRIVGKRRFGAPVWSLSGDHCLREGPAPKDVQLSPRAAGLLELWRRSGTQWEIGPNGPSCLKYTAVEWIAERIGVDFDDRAFLIFQHLESRTLAAMREQSRAELEHLKKDKK